MSGVFTIDVLGVMHVDCVRRTNFKDKLFLYTLVPLGIAASDMLYQAGRVAKYGGTFTGGKAFKWQVRRVLDAARCRCPHALKLQPLSNLRTTNVSLGCSC